MTSRGRGTNPFIIQVAERLERLGLQLPALVALQAGRPFAFLAGQLVWMVEPALSLFMSHDFVIKSAELLEDPAAVEALIACLEQEMCDHEGGTEWTA